MMVMDALLGLLGSVIPGIRRCRSGAAAAQQSPFPFLVCIPGGKAEAWPGDAASPKPPGQLRAAVCRSTLGKLKTREQLGKGDRRML